MGRCGASCNNDLNEKSEMLIKDNPSIEDQITAARYCKSPSCQKDNNSVSTKDTHELQTFS